MKTRLDVSLPPSTSDYFLVLLFLCISGNLAFTTGGGMRQEFFLLFALALVLFRVLICPSLNWWVKILPIFIYFVFLLLFQAILLDFFSLTTMLGYLVRILIAAGVVATVRFFRVAFVRVMVWLTLTSFVFHIPASLLGEKLLALMRPVAVIVGAEPSGVNERVNILVHNFMGGAHIIRNAGIFWESGAFSGYLALALLMLATISRDLPSSLVKRWCIILSAGVLSTLSTTGIVILPFALLTFNLAKLSPGRAYGKKLFIALAFLGVSIPFFYSIWQLDFVGPKITMLYERALFMEAGWQLSRFGALIFDWTYIQQRPYFGWGQSSAMLGVLHPELDPELDRFNTGNGFSGFVRQMGFLGMLIFLSATWYSLGRLKVTGSLRIVMFLVIIALLHTQSFLSHPVFISLMFLFLERNPASEARRIQRLASRNRRRTQPVAGLRVG